MAYSGDFSTSNQYIKFNLEIIPGTPDIANNRTPVTVKLWARRTNTGYTTWGTGYVTLSVDGMNCDSGSKEITITSTNAVYHTWSGNIPHGTDGKKYLTVSGSIQIGGGILSSSVQSYGTWLSDIPRVSDFSLSTSSVDAGGNVTVSISKASTSFNHNITYYRVDGTAVTIQPWDWTGTSHTFTVAASDASLTPNSTSGVASVQVTTYSGGTMIGYKTKNLTITVPASVKPTLGSGTTLTLVNGTWGLYLKGKSSVKVTANSPTGAYGSTIRSVTFSAGGYSNTINSATSGVWEYTTGVLNSAGAQSVSVTVTDSRGRSNTYTNGFTVADYYSPYFKSHAAVRCLADGTPDTNGTYIRVSANLDYCVVGSNSCVTQYRFREAGQTWSAWANVTNGGNTGAIGGGLISTDKTYEVEIRGADYFTETIKPVLVPTMVLPIDFLAGGTGVAIGKVAELENVFDVNMYTAFRAGVEVGGSEIVKGDLQINSAFVHKGEFDDGIGHYNYESGYLIRTNIHMSTNTMFEVHITGNSYGTLRPIDIRINGYTYQQQLYNMSMLVNCYDITINAMFAEGGYVCFWLAQANLYSTIRVNLKTSTGTPSCRYWVTNSARPTSGVANLMDIPKIASVVCLEYGANFAKYSDGTLECWGVKTLTTSINVDWYGTPYGYVSAVYDRAFITPPAVSVGVGSGELTQVAYSKNSRTDGFTMYVSNTRVVNNLSVDLHYFAKGRWW